jgi:hypothetical protein
LLIEEWPSCPIQLFSRKHFFFLSLSSSVMILGWLSNPGNFFGKVKQSYYYGGEHGGKLIPWICCFLKSFLDGPGKGSTYELNLWAHPDSLKSGVLYTYAYSEKCLNLKARQTFSLIKMYRTLRLN